MEKLTNEELNFITRNEDILKRLNNFSDADIKFMYSYIVGLRILMEK